MLTKATFLSGDHVSPVTSAPFRSCEEAGDFSGLGVADKHLVIALTFEFAFVSVGLDPEVAVGRECHSVGRVEHDACVYVLRPCIGIVVDGRGLS